MASFGSAYASRLPAWVLIGAVLGIFIGVVFGEAAAVLEPIGTSYVLMMEIVVFPYIICTLLHGLGSLSPGTAWRLFRRSWVIYVAVWGITFVVIFLLSFAIPPAPPPSFIDATAGQKGLNLLELLIPANPFEDLVQNHLPAIVIFSIVFGIAIQRIEKKDAFLSVMDLIRKASVTIWGWVVMLAPIGVFALFANTAGTLEPAALADLSLYLVTMILGAAILAFWILPSIMAALCPLSTREVLRDLQSALVIAVVTTLSVAALPFVQQATEKLATQLEIEARDRNDIIQTTLAVSYPLGQLGNYFIWLFVLFAAFYYHVPIDLGDQLLLPLIVLLSGIGSPSSSIDAVAFLTGWLNFPDKATNLYVGMMAITRYAQVVVSVMGFAFICILVTLNYYGKLRLRMPRFALSLLVSCGVLAAVTATGRVVQNQIPVGQPSPYLTFGLPAEITEDVDAVIETTTDSGQGAARPPAPADSSSTSLLQRIHRNGEIRVGYNPHIVPFSYRNSEGERVGYDIAYAYRLAQDLGVRLRLVPFEWPKLAQNLADDRFDLAASGIFVTDDRLQRFEVSEPYFKSPVALVVRAADAKKFLSLESIEAHGNLTIAVVKAPILVPLAERLFRKSKVEVLESYADLANRPEIDAALWTLEEAKAWAATRARYTAVVPKDMDAELLFAYLMPRGARELRIFVNYWLRLQRVNGFHDRMVRHWLDGEPEPRKTPRWSLLGYLIGWEHR
ncbi:MAG: cation:dicarboxylase symporter family transporter [Alphaproteobacteria bacterium]|nr:cation:dicarboxylase symporter family transporter [Alphaproteobacteria bacterium]